MELLKSALWAAFEDGRRIETACGVMEMRCCDVGSLVLPTGSIVVCDPQFDLNQEPFSIRVSPGDYPVYLALTQFPGVALAMVRFADGEPSAWVPANPRHFSVDSATACIIDARLARLLAHFGDHDRYDRHWKRIADGMDENDGLWCNVPVDDRSGANMIAFRTMDGDGVFSSYFGYTSDNTLTCLVLDFFFTGLAP